ALPIYDASGVDQSRPSGRYLRRTSDGHPEKLGLDLAAKKEPHVPLDAVRRARHVEGPSAVSLRVRRAADWWSDGHADVVDGQASVDVEDSSKHRRLDRVRGRGLDECGRNDHRPSK